MFRNLFAVVVAVLAIWSVGAAADAPKDKTRLVPEVARAQPPYVHAVLFHLKKDAPEGEIEALIRDSHQMLGKIPSVRSLWVGRPAAKATPKVARTDYQVGLLVLFDNYEGLQTYLTHKLHLQYIERHGKYWAQTPVYDFVNQKK